jgi:hypothetical protein
LVVGSSPTRPTIFFTCLLLENCMDGFLGFTLPIGTDDATMLQYEQLKGLSLTEACVEDVLYLRTKPHYVTELEAELIALHKAGTPPRIMEFGLPNK